MLHVLLRYFEDYGVVDLGHDFVSSIIESNNPLICDADNGGLRSLGEGFSKEVLVHAVKEQTPSSEGIMDTTRGPNETTNPWVPNRTKFRGHGVVAFDEELGFAFGSPKSSKVEVFDIDSCESEDDDKLLPCHAVVGRVRNRLERFVDRFFILAHLALECARREFKVRVNEG